MKIGIFTFLYCYNYGAVLQAKALQEAIKNTIGPCEQIDYRSDFLCECYAPRKLSLKVGPKRLLINFARNLVTLKWRYVFDKFISEIPHSKTYDKNTVNESASEYDAFVCGSDMVFDRVMTKDDRNYFLEFVDSPKFIASYAASVGEYIHGDQSIYKSLLKRFNMLSLRENSMSKLLESEIGISSEVVPDPTLLFTADHWKRMLNLKEKRSRKPYVLIYIISQKPEKMCQLARKIANEKNCDTRIIHIYMPSTGIKMDVDHITMDASPKQFLELFMGAEHIVTSAFHGLVFSLIFNKPFTVYLPTMSSERIVDLLEYLNLENRISKTVDVFDNTDIDYKAVNNKLDVLRKTGYEYLSRMKDNMCKDIKNNE